MTSLHKRFARKHSSTLSAKKENRSSSTNLFLDLADQSDAFYYLALTSHFKAKDSLNSNGGVLTDSIRSLLKKSIVYYERNLEINQDLKDKVAEGRTLGNLGNVHYLLQDYSTSIEYLEKRLAIAKDSHDPAGERRAHGNLGNAHLYLEDFDKALHHYREAMTLGEMMNDQTFLARMNYTIARVYALKQDYETSIYFHEKHLQFARQFEDSIGQCRAYFHLSQLYDKVNQEEKAKKYDSLYRALSREIDEPIEDTISISTRSAPTHPSLKNLRTDSISISLSEGATTTTSASSHSPCSARSNPSVNSSVTDVRSVPKKTKLKSNLMQHFTKRSPMVTRKESLPAEKDDLVELVCRMQKSRFDDQRCDLKNSTTNTSDGNRTSAQLDEIFNTVDRLQKNRLNDQRTDLPVSNANAPSRLSNSKEEFFDQLAKCQDSRLDDQRAVLIPIHNHRPNSASSITKNENQSSAPSIDLPSKTLPDDDFFSLLNRLQSRRIDHQRTCLPSNSEKFSPTSSSSSSSTRARANP